MRNKQPIRASNAAWRITMEQYQDLYKSNA